VGPEAPNQRMQLSGADHSGLHSVPAAGAGQRTVEFGSTGGSPAADAQFR
jgi:hypothetical protein